MVSVQSLGWSSVKHEWDRTRWRYFHVWVAYLVVGGGKAWVVDTGSAHGDLLVSLSEVPPLFLHFLCVASTPFVCSYALNCVRGSTLPNTGFSPHGAA